MAGPSLAIWLATPAGAHGFGQRYELPIPLSFYFVGTAAVIVVSFVMVGLFVRDVSRPHADARVDLLATPVGRLIASPMIASALKLLVIIAFLVTIIAGLRGDQNPYRNIAPTMVWIIGWVGVAYVSAFLGNLWTLVNPWRTLFRSAAKLCKRFTGRPDLALGLRYPAMLGVWPAFVLLLALCVDRARLSKPRDPPLPGLAGDRLFRPDLRRHGAVRLRDMAAAR